MKVALYLTGGRMHIEVVRVTLPTPDIVWGKVGDRILIIADVQVTQAALDAAKALASLEDQGGKTTETCRHPWGDQHHRDRAEALAIKDTLPRL